MGKNANMKRSNTHVKAMLLVLLVGLILIAGCAENAKTSLNKNVNENNEAAEITAFKTVSSGSMENGNALIELTPKGTENGRLNVDISANTHSVNLGYFDLMEITSLEYDGNSINPVSAPTLAGHHNSGTLVFDTGKELKSFKVIIKNIPSIEERVFEWP